MRAILIITTIIVCAAWAICQHIVNPREIGEGGD